MKSLLVSAIRRVFKQVHHLANQLTEDLVLERPVDTIRPVGDIFLHILRSGEVYMTGITTNIWRPLPYTLEKYGTADAIRTLYQQVETKINTCLEDVTEEMLTEEVLEHNRPATKAELLLELIEHTTHHQGQIMVYYRIFGIPPAQIEYIV